MSSTSKNIKSGSSSSRKDTAFITTIDDLKFGYEGDKMILPSRNYAAR